MLSLSQLGEILLLIFFRGEEKNFLSPGIMRSAKTRRAFCTVASAALLATSSQTGVVGEPTTSSSFSSVSDESSLCGDEARVASKDPFEKLSRLCSVDVEYGVGPLSIISDGASTNSGADTFVDNSEASSSIAKEEEEEEEEDKEYTFPRPFVGEIISWKRTNLFKSLMFSRTDKASPMVESMIARY